MLYKIKKISYSLGLIFYFGEIESMASQKNSASFPDYVDIHKSKNAHQMLQTPSEEVKFPLSDEDQKIIEVLTQKFRQEKNCAGLAAPQIGFHKKIIVFSAPDDPDLKNHRSDLTQTMEETLWINPSYEGIGEEKFEDREGCFSVEGYVGDVKRFKKILYHAYDQLGKEITGIAEGFLARIIQHEIDHVNGQLYIDLVPKDKLMTREQYNETLKHQTK